MLVLLLCCPVAIRNSLSEDFLDDFQPLTEGHHGEMLWRCQYNSVRKIRGRS